MIDRLFGKTVRCEAPHSELPPRPTIMSHWRDSYSFHFHHKSLTASAVAETVCVTLLGTDQPPEASEGCHALLFDLSPEAARDFAARLLAASDEAEAARLAAKG